MYCQLEERPYCRGICQVVEHKSITHKFLNAEDARAWWETRIEAEILDKCEVTDLEVQRIGKA
jgi:hypothetical protein